MKKLRLFLLTLVATIAGTNIALADAYTVDFNTAISTSSHDFAVASNWGHIVGSNNYDNYGPYYMSYGYSSTDGVDGTGALRVGAQNGYFSGSTQSGANFTDGNYDYLITPKVNGAITLQVKRYAVTGYSSYVKIFAVNEAGTTVGTEIATTLSGDINESDWVTLSLTLTEEQRLAIRAQAVLLDNFTAESANIQKMPAMTISSISRADNGSTTYFDMNANGTYNVQYKVKITNSGEVALVAGTTENYSLSVSIDGTTYGSFDVPVDLAVGETSDEFLASIVVPAGAPTGWKYRYLVENLTGTKNTASLTWSNTLAYNPMPFLIKKGNEPIGKGRNLTSETAINFGMISEATTLNYEIFANNAGDLQVKSITATGDFTIVPAETLPFTITAHTGMYVDITANATETSDGVLTITYVDKNGADATTTVTLKQIVLDASKWMADFAGGTWPEGTIHQSSLSLSTSSYYGYDNAIKSSSSYSNKFFTPLLHATAGERMTFDAMLDNNSGSIKVYVTTDRNNLGAPVLTLGSSQLNTSSMTSQSVTVAEEGNYYVVFEVYNAMLDNLYGFEPVAVDHDIMVNSFILKGTSAEDVTVQTGDALSPKFEILPVQSEAAGTYSVKLYANDEVVATIANENLTDLTAGTSKTFTFSYTPSVTATTTFEIHAAIEFTDATVVNSSTLNLTVTCEPVFHFVNALPVNSNEPSNYTTPINFGRTSTADTKTFYIYNWGKAPLQVKSISMPEGFTTSLTAPIEVAASSGESLDIVFSGEAGSYSGNLSITYVGKDGTDQTFEIAVSGIKLDPSLWYADFGTENDNSGLPAGSLVQANVSSGTPVTGDAALGSSNNTNNLFITPLMNIAQGDKMTFDARMRYSLPGTVKVYLVSNHIEVAEATTDADFEALNPILVSEFSISESEFTAKEFILPSSGNYYLAFKLYNVWVDNLYGLKLAPASHDWKLVSSSIPAEAMQNKTVNATVNIANFGIAEEAAGSYNVTVYVDEEPVVTLQPATAIPTVNQLSAAGTQISVPFKYGVVGTFPVYIEVEADGYKVKTEAVEVNFTGEIANADAIAVGSGTTFSYNYAPIDFFNFEQARTSDIVYTAAQLKAFGIDNSNKITTLAFRGTVSSAKTLSKSSLKAWVGLVSDYTLGTPNKTALTEIQIYNAGDMVFVSGTNELTITLPEAITYDGTSNLRIYLEGGGNSEYVSWNFASDANYPNMKWSNNAATKYNPILYVTLASEVATLTGTVTDGTNPVEGATVTMISEDADKVQYTGETDADGKYSIEVIQASRTYTVTASKDGAEATVKNVSDFSQPMNLALVALPELTINNEALAATAPDVANVTIARSLKTGWNAIVLPVTLTAAEIKEAFGENIELAAYDSDEGTTNVTVKFTNATKIVAGTPYLLWLESVPATAPRFVNKTIAKDTKTVTGQVFDFVGTYQSVIANAGDYFIQGGKFVKATNNNTILPFRSYLKLKDGGAGARYIRFSVNGEDFDVPTAIEAIATEAPAKLEGIYNMQGQKVDHLKKGGLYIINGKKVMVK